MKPFVKIKSKCFSYMYVCPSKGQTMTKKKEIVLNPLPEDKILDWSKSK